ncbi:MAG: pimeloyl-ACP methyl ester carboxylesterase [Planctomycetota bacterium]|jgi:pimeloyl-ACP methyl ester carboxylesterase
MFDDIRNAEGERLDCSFTPAAENQSSKELVVIGHGVTGNKDREWAVTLAEALAAGGFASVRFSFSGNGDSEGDFRESTPTKEVSDLGAVIDQCDDWKVSYVGHSMGAAVGVLRASKDKRIKRMVSLAGMVETADFAKRKFGDLAPGEALMWDKPECPLSQKFMDDMNAIDSVVEFAMDVEVPWLFVHGTMDDVVPIDEAEMILTQTGGSADFVDIAGSDHVFSGAAAAIMADRVVAWLKEH